MNENRAFVKGGFHVTWKMQASQTMNVSYVRSSYPLFDGNK